MDAEIGEGGAGGRYLRPPADPAHRTRPVPAAEGQVVDDAEVTDEAEVLVHEAEAGVPPGARRARVHRIPVDGDRAARIGVVVAGENLDQRRLPGAVLADQRVDLAAHHLEVHVVERQLTRKRLRQAGDREDGLWVDHESTPTWRGTRPRSGPGPTSLRWRSARWRNRDRRSPRSAGSKPSRPRRRPTPPAWLVIWSTRIHIE